MLRRASLRVQLTRFGARWSTRDAAAQGVVAAAADERSRLAQRVETAPLSTLTVKGLCSALTVKTNMETYYADAWAEGGGDPCELASVATIEANEAGDICLLATQAHAAITVAVPAAFNVRVDMRGGACDVDMRGWLEGDVDISTERGSVGVATVRGVLTKVRTGGGDVTVGSVDGNLDAETGAGDVAVGKVLGEEVRLVASGGSLRLKAAYAKRAELNATGAVHAAVLSAERGAVRAGEDSRLSSLDGEFDISLSDSASLEVQAGEQLRRLRLIGVDGASPVAHADGGAPGPPRTIEVHLPAALSTEASAIVAELEVGDDLPSRQLDPARHVRYDPATDARATPDRTPPGSSAVNAEAMDAFRAAANAAATRATDAPTAAGRECALMALSEDAGPACAALDILAPAHRLRLVRQDFFARFKALSSPKASST